MLGTGNMRYVDLGFIALMYCSNCDQAKKGVTCGPDDDGVYLKMQAGRELWCYVWSKTIGVNDVCPCKGTAPKRRVGRMLSVGYF